MERIFAKRAASTEYDAEMMQLTAGVLQRNPDITTLWNIRRECLLKLKETSADDVEEVFDKDLSLTRACLEVNPKSYCAWHHRRWILKNVMEPNWQREVHICTEYLKKDERNCKSKCLCDLSIQFLLLILIFFQFCIQFLCGLIDVMPLLTLEFHRKKSWNFAQRKFKIISPIIRRGMRAANCCLCCIRTTLIRRDRSMRWFYAMNLNWC